MLSMCSFPGSGQGHNICMPVACCKMSLWYFGGRLRSNIYLVSRSMGQYLVCDVWSDMFMVILNDVAISSYLLCSMALFDCWCFIGLFTLDWDFDEVGSHIIFVVGFLNGK